MSAILERALERAFASPCAPFSLPTSFVSFVIAVLTSVHVALEAVDAVLEAADVGGYAVEAPRRARLSRPLVPPSAGSVAWSSWCRNSAKSG